VAVFRTMASVELATGSIFAGRYRVLGRLASGGMGAVYEVLHLETRRRRALKVMLPALFEKLELRDRFRREAHVTASVKSEHLVDVFDAGVDEASSMPFLVMELLEGEDLGRLVDRVGSIPPSDVVAYLSQVASALDRTHAASIVHRDLKPENLFVTHRENGTVCLKILDFGISKIVNEGATGGRNTTSIGTPAYMAPEQIVGGPVTPAADLHALGLIAYTLLTGRAYWQDDVESTDNALAFALRAAQGIREGAVSRAGRHGHTLPNEFDAWFARAVDLEPKRRFGTATETVHGLAEALGVPAPSHAALPASGRRSAARDGAGAPAPRVDSEFVPSTMHGAELGPTRRKPTTLVRWLAAGAALGLAAVAAAAFMTKKAPLVPVEPLASDRATRAPTTAASEPELVVAPLAPATGLDAREPGASPASPEARSTPKRTPGELAPKPAKSAAPAASVSVHPPAAPASAASASATASFPAASVTPKVKYTRD
jgi:eukaryotic-like serine/threonine-protein kinase